MTEDFIKHHPNTAVTRSFLGNKDYASTFAGASNVLLYQLRNLMSFRDLGQLKMTRVFTDGTVITAWSFKNHGTGVYQDFVRVDVRNSLGIGGAKEVCTITYIDLPATVSPMQYPHEIQAGEVEGTDYIKTYYMVDVSGCPTCDMEPTVDFSFQFVDATIEHKESPHDAREHCIFSSDGGCFAEIIDQGTDAEGTYIRWKVYTESLGQDRTGYGFVKLTAIIPSVNASIACSFDQVIKVDCCNKSAADRAVEIWWEDFGTCEPFIIYPGVAYDAICKMPTTIPLGGTSGLSWYTSVPPYQPLYSIPEIKGSCLPVEWTLSGPLSFRGNSKKDDEIIFLQVEEGSCTSEASVTLRDRCSSEYTIVATPCCQDAAALSILYTSLVMSCSGQQTFTVNGGCAPYSWSITSGGGILNTNVGSEVIYTAPATNVDCTSNPTIRVTDCCGTTAQVSLAVNCYTPDVLALEEVDLIKNCCYKLRNPGCGGQTYNAGFWLDDYKWDCNGTLFYHSMGYTGVGSYGACPPPPPCVNYCACDSVDEPGCWGTYPDCGCGGGCPCNTLIDKRSADQKSQGCCPLNPFTGLPY